MSDITHYVSRSAPALLPVFRSRNQLELLTHLFLNSGERFSISDLERRTGIPQQTVSREVERLERAGIVVTSRVGRTKLVQANEASPYFPELRALLLKVGGPAGVLADELRQVPGVVAAFVFGSWARRYEGEVGPPPGDVDILIVGDADPYLVDAACRAAERRLLLEVNAVVITEREWAEARSGFLRQIKRAALIPIVGDVS